LTRKFPPRLTVEKQEVIVLNGQSVSYILKRSVRARFARLQIDREAQLIVVAPKSYRPHQITGLLQNKQRWILGHLERMQRLRQTEEQKALKTGTIIRYLGRDLRIIINSVSVDSEGVHLRGDKLVIKSSDRNGQPGILLYVWYRNQAVREITGRVLQLCDTLSLKLNRITIRNQKTRWGSCSRKGNLNLNWKLVMTPEPVINYVIAHELAHLTEMNHSKKFWALVERYYPGWRECKKWLREHSEELSAVLPN
jgi:predicted metal-dependent hydrolase